jgi:hypothetical protein
VVSIGLGALTRLAGNERALVAVCLAAMTTGFAAQVLFVCFYWAFVVATSRHPSEGGRPATYTTASSPCLAPTHLPTDPAFLHRRRCFTQRSRS